MPRPIVHRQRIEAPVNLVWDTLVDVERMPEWTPSMSSVVALGNGPIGFGSRFAIKQPGMQKMEWVVTDFEPVRRFRWSSTIGGVTTVGDHKLSPKANGEKVDVEFSITQHGRGAALVALLTGRRTRRMVEQELAGLKAVSEAAASRGRDDAAQV